MNEQARRAARKRIPGEISADGAYRMLPMTPFERGEMTGKMIAVRQHVADRYTAAVELAAAYTRAVTYGPNGQMFHAVEHAQTAYDATTDELRCQLQRFEV